MAVLDRPLDEAPAGGEVHDVVLVDERRAAQQRHRVHRLGLRRVLDELEDPVPVDHLARGVRQALAHLEPPAVHQPRPALARPEVVQPHPQPARRAEPAALERAPQRRRIGEEEVGRGERIHQELAGHPRLARRGLVDPRRLEQVAGQLLAQQVVAAILGGGQLLLVSAAQRHHLIAVGAMLGLGLGLVGLALRRQLQRLLLLQGGGGLLLLAAQLSTAPSADNRPPNPPRRSDAAAGSRPRCGGRPRCARLRRRRRRARRRARLPTPRWPSPGWCGAPRRPRRTSPPSSQARPLHLGPTTFNLLANALAQPVNLVLTFAQLLVRVVETRLESLLALDGLLVVLSQLRRLLVGGDQIRLNPSVASSRSRRARSCSADLVLVVQDLPIFGVQRIPQIEDVLLFLVDDLPQAQQVALLGESALVCRLRHPLALFVQLLAQRLALRLQ